jgi:hypothetical protein
VAQLPQDAARLLWGIEDGDDAHDMGYAALQSADAKPLLVNPAAVAYITDPVPPRREWREIPSIASVGR